MTEVNHAQLPPHSKTAEQALLAGLIRRPEAIDDLVGFGPDSFYFSSHAVIFGAIVSLRQSRQPVDLSTVYEHLNSTRRLEEAGGTKYLGEVIDCDPTGANVEYNARIVQDRAVLRRLIYISQTAIRDAYDAVCPADEIVDGVARQLSEAQGGTVDRHPAKSMSDVLSSVARRIDQRACGDTVAVKTGFFELDSMMGGLHAGELVCLAARPGVGKSVFAQQVSRVVASEGNRVLFVALEMEAVEVGQRLVVGESRVPNYRVKNGKISADDAIAIASSIDRLGKLPIRWDDEPGLTVKKISIKAKALAKREGLDFLVVDYLQLLLPDNPRLPRFEQVGQMSRGLKMLARELQIPILILAQLNRASEGEDRTPRLSDIRESGSVEQDCDAVLFLHRTGADRAEPEPIDCIVAKQRNGPTGTIPLAYHGSRFQFSSVIPSDERPVKFARSVRD